MAGSLAALGVTHVFAMASIHNLPIYDALERCSDIDVVDMRHEQAVVHAADGFSRVTGELGVALTSTGPGAANAMGGLLEASVACSPVLMITGQVASRYYGQGRGLTHEAERQQDMLQTVARRVASLRPGVDLDEVLFDVAADLLTGRPQPGAVEIPIDLQYAPAPCGSQRRSKARPVPVDDDALQRAVALLRQAERPLIWAGGGVIRGNASAEVTELAERLGAPVIMTVEGRGSVADDHPLSLGATTELEAMSEVVAGADVVLGLGTRFRAAATRQWQLPMHAALIHVDVDPTVFGRSYEPAVAVVGDLRAVASRLASALDGEPTRDRYVEHAMRCRQSAEKAELHRIGPDHLHMLNTIRRVLPSDGNMVRDSTLAAYLWADRLLPVLRPRTSMRPVSVAIGPGLPLGIGAACAGGAPTVVIQGDGGLMLSLGELSTAARYRLPLVLCVFNDHGYGVLRAIEESRFAGRQFGVDLAAPNFAAVGRAMGLTTRSVDSPEAFDSAFEAAVADGGPWLLDIDMRKLSPMQLPDW